MRRRRFRSSAPALGFLALILSSIATGGELEPSTVEELFERSGDAYRASPSLEIVLTTSVEISGTEPGERIVRYLLGKGREAVLEIGALMRVVVTNDSIYVERAGLEDRYLQMFFKGDLAAAVAAVRGKSPLAGFWVPPQAALRNGGTLAEILEAFRYSSLLEELAVADYRRLPGSFHEVRLEAANGSCIARFDPTSFYLEEVDYRIEPPGVPKGSAVSLQGRFATRAIEHSSTLFAFDGGERSAVASLRDLATPPPGIHSPPESILSSDALASRLQGIDDLAAAIREKAIILVGEDHLYEEPPAYLTALLEKLGDKPVSFLLEMPYDAQPGIDRYLRDGDEATLDEIFKGKPVLQLQHLLRWARQHREKAPTVRAIDEPQYEIRLKRAYLSDTRNPTMAKAIVREWKDHPDRRIVVYAGQLHMMKAGRYRVDQPSRDTAGSRLPGLGVPPDDIAVVMLNGGENFHLHTIWSQPGVLPIDGQPVRIPISYFIDYPIFGIEFADQAFDYFVNLGSLTRIEIGEQAE